ncbi:MAG: hypothetical protein OEZ65_13925 [Gemmatimonadota bacterium]|nr:hypothetical protein [Gemmatimonadota bacterium]MDH5760682.1 hypothetical protein [Gemmatimonadota bacterium]
MMARIRQWRDDLRADWREGGWRKVLKERGWRLLVLFIVFYLVRDVILYVLIPLGIVSLFR